jgi:formamidopyrimidine-DNA glycosylase
LPAGFIGALSRLALPAPKSPRHAAFDFPAGSLLWTEAGSQKRASLHVVSGEDGLRSLDPGGIEVLDASLDHFAAALVSANHTLKRALTDPRLFSGTTSTCHLSSQKPLTLSRSAHRISTARRRGLPGFAALRAQGQIP